MVANPPLLSRQIFRFVSNATHQRDNVWNDSSLVLDLLRLGANLWVHIVRLPWINASLQFRMTHKQAQTHTHPVASVVAAPTGFCLLRWRHTCDLCTYVNSSNNLRAERGRSLFMGVTTCNSHTKTIISKTGYKSLDYTIKSQDTTKQI